MEIQLTAHAEAQIEERGLDREQVIEVASEPGQVLYPEDQPPVAQSRLPLGGKTYLLRVVFRDVEEGVRLVLTAYRTSKVEKYWQEDA